MAFTDDELVYLRSQRLGRLATVAPDGQPDAVPVAFFLDGPYIYVPGFFMTKTRKYRNIAGGNTKVALTIDDVVSTDPWAPRFVRIYGTAESVTPDQPVAGGRFGPGPYIRITPTVSWSWNLEGKPLRDQQTGGVTFAPRKTIHQPPA